MGVVVKGHDTRLNRVVAIKVLAPELATHATARKRFLREAQAAAAVVHDNVVTIHAVEEVHLPYLVMEFVAGPSLQQRIDRQGPLALDEILRIGTQIAAGLAAAHAQGLIHRDIKPANILLENGIARVRITDFGLARAVDDATMTRSGEVTGTPQYMSPEQAQGFAVDARSDLFSLGCVLYAMCTGRSPFRAETTMATLRRVCDDAPRPIREVNPDIPHWLQEIIDRLLAKRPEERFQEAIEVAELLGERLAAVQDPARAPLRRTPPPGRAARRGRAWAIAACVLMSAIAGVGLSEATGVTHMADFVATVLRIRTPQGTLVLEIDDPGVNVAVEGNGERVTVSGAGIETVELRPGLYQLRATKDGKAVREELVSIDRGDKQVVKISLEQGGEPPAQGETRRFVGHTEPVQSVAFSPDGRHVLTGSWDQTARWWSVETGQEVRRFDVAHVGELNGIQCVAVSPDGHRAIAGSVGGIVWLWDVETGRVLGRTRHATAEYYGANSVVFTRDGKQALVANFDGFVQVWNVDPWTESRQFQDSAALWSIDVSPDGGFAITAGTSVKDSATFVGVRRFENQMEVQPLEPHAGGIWRATISPDSRSILTAGSDATVRLVDVQNGQEVRRFTGHTDEVRDVAFSTDGRLAVSGSHDGTVRLWDVESGKESHRFMTRGQVYCVGISPDKRYAISGGADGIVRLWGLTQE
jgi:hypothetical protein